MFLVCYEKYKIFCKDFLAATTLLLHIMVFSLKNQFREPGDVENIGISYLSDHFYGSYNSTLKVEVPQTRNPYMALKGILKTSHKEVSRILKEKPVLNVHEACYQSAFTKMESKTI